MKDGAQFKPRSAEGLGRGVALAVLAHVLLALCLALGLNWRSDPVLIAEAELWDALPETQAPAPLPPVQAEPEPEPKPEPPPEPEPDEPEPVVQAPAEVPSAPVVKEKPKPKPEPKPKPKPKPVPKEKIKAPAKEKPKAPASRETFASTTPKDKAPAKGAAVSTAQTEAQREAQRQAQLARVMNSLGGSGQGAAGTGSGARSAGAGANYAGKLRARIVPNIVFTETLVGNPTAFVEIRCAPDGRILSHRLLDSSGSSEWDSAVMRAIERTDALPMDDNGRLPDTVFEIGISPRDRR